MTEERKMEIAAEVLLGGTELSMLDAARIALELQEVMAAYGTGKRSPMDFCRYIIGLGAAAYAQEGHTVSFQNALEKSLQSRAGRRPRTIAEIRQYCRRIVHNYPELASMPVRAVTAEYCRELIENSFQTLPMQRKARRLLHSIFAFCLRHGWCSSNPLAAVDLPPVAERPIEVLPLRQIRRLLATARSAEHLPCAPALGLMLWAGIRPTEVTRLRWEDIHLEDRVISVGARHSKTGGARLVTLYPVLARWLQETAPHHLPFSGIIPPAWERRWHLLRRAAGFEQWHPDTLRHTFASYHLRYFGDYSKLQLDMGHGDLQLLRTRYLSMKGVSKAGADEFWGKRRTAAEAPAQE